MPCACVKACVRIVSSYLQTCAHGLQEVKPLQLGAAIMADVRKSVVAALL